MSVNDELETAAGAVASLRRSVASLQGRLGDTVDVQRLKDDVTRVAADLNLLARGAGPPPAGAAQPGEIVYIPDEDYDPSFWADAEDEGLGTHGRA
jgi:hypothetical protein